MLFFLLSILLLSIAHILKALRLTKFVEIYEEPKEKNILAGLSFGYLINFILPYRIGDIFRAWYMGRKMKNKYSFSFSLVLIDRILDVIVVGLLFALLYFLGVRSTEIAQSILFYIAIAIAIVILLILCYRFNYLVKKCIVKIARIFNKDIELKILKFFWCFITAFKDMLQKMNKKRLILYTFFMWVFYLSSYYSFALASKETDFITIFTRLFSNSSFDLSTSSLSFQNISMLVYLLVPLILLLLLCILPINIFKKKQKQYLELLPQANIKDRLVFLEGYFSSKSSNYYKNYMMLNQDISILQDFSAGSNATTMLCTKDGDMFFRKYSFGSDSEKLSEQIKWLEENKKKVPLTEVENIKKGNGYCSYDMPYYSGAVSCFNYVHSVPIKEAWNVLEESLNSLDKLYQKKEKAPLSNIEKYIENKVIKNIERIENGKYLKPLLKYDTLLINGKEYHNLKYYKKYLSKEYLSKIFEHDVSSSIHGDFTMENIIVTRDHFYFIDPNGGNIHNSPNLDYAKLLQSLHGGYEFLMNTKNVEVEENKICFLSSKSLVYEKLYQKYEKYLKEKFAKETVRSIYFHEIVHWLRLLPYKIEKNGERTILFYAEMIIVLNDVIERFGD